MKQPELGQKILELRKSKNLTQEELVEECNVSIRTLQRIESGEVTPRSSTIKIILAALGEDFNSIKESVKGNSSEELIRAENTLQIAWISGIIYFMIGFLEAGLDYIRYERGDIDIPIEFYISVKIISLVSYAMFMSGIISLANFFNVTILKIASFLMVGITILIIGFDVASLFFYVSDQMLMVLLPSISIPVGCIGIVLGIGMIRLQDGMGRIARIAGIFELIMGFCFVTVILFLLGYILLIPAILLEIIMLYKGYEFIKAEQKKEFGL